MGFCGHWSLQNGRSRVFTAAFDSSVVQRDNQYKSRFFLLLPNSYINIFHLQSLFFSVDPGWFCSVFTESLKFKKQLQCRLFPFFSFFFALPLARLVLHASSSLPKFVACLCLLHLDLGSPGDVHKSLPPLLRGKEKIGKNPVFLLCCFACEAESPCKMAGEKTGRKGKQLFGQVYLSNRNISLPGLSSQTFLLTGSSITLLTFISASARALWGSSGKAANSHGLWVAF